MPNWCTTDYVIEGPKKVLNKIYRAVSSPKKKNKHASAGWEGNALMSLDIDPDKYEHMRGFISSVSSFAAPDTVLRISADEAWGRTLFAEALLDKFHDLNIFYREEEPGFEIYVTNDAEGKYFPERFQVNACFNNDWQTEYFETKEAALEWIKEFTKSKVTTEEEADSINKEESDDFVYIHEFEIE